MSRVGRARNWLAGHRGFVAVTLISALLGPPLFLAGRTEIAKSNGYASEGTSVITGTARIDSCVTHGPVSLSTGFGLSTSCSATASWPAKTTAGAPPTDREAPKQITLDGGQVTDDQIGSTVKVENRLVPKGRNTTTYVAVVVPAPASDANQQRTGEVLQVLGIIVGFPFYVPAGLFGALGALYAVLWSITRVAAVGRPKGQ